MTNGEKIKEIFPNIIKYGNILIDDTGALQKNILFDDSWWNAEYKDPTTKKDCNTCTHNNETDGSYCYACVKDMCNNYDPTTKNNLGIRSYYSCNSTSNGSYHCYGFIVTNRVIYSGKNV